jgi:hypothetical protein
MTKRPTETPRPYDLLEGLERLLRVIAHEAGHAVAAWASPRLPAPSSIVFEPAKGEAWCTIEGWSFSPDSTDACLDAAAFFLGGAAGETVAYGRFEAIGGTDLRLALDMAGFHRTFAGAPRRRARRTDFVARLPRGVFRECHAFLDAAYGLAVARVERHRDRHEALRDSLKRGYVAGTLAFDAAALSACLGPRPSRDPL